MALIPQTIPFTVTSVTGGIVAVSGPALAAASSPAPDVFTTGAGVDVVVSATVATSTASTTAPTITSQTNVAYAYSVDEYRARFLRPQTKIIRRVEILNSDGITLWAADDIQRLVKGSVSVDFNRDERRSADFELANFDNALVHQPGGFWYDKILRAWRGIEFYDSSGLRRYEVPVGNFMIDRVSSGRFPKTVKVTARDFTKKCLLSKFVQATSFSSASAIEDVVAAMAASAGIVNRIIPVTGKTLGTDYTFEAGKSRWEAMKEVSTAFGYELFFNAEGYLVMRPFLDPTLSAISHTFSVGPETGNLVDWDKSSNDTRIFNHIVVIGSTADSDTVPVWAEAVNNSTISPTRIALLGDRVDIYESSLVTNTTQAQELAASMLMIAALEEFEINMRSIVFPWLEVGEIAEFKTDESNPNFPERFLLTQLNIPLDLEPMSAVGRRILNVGGLGEL